VYKSMRVASGHSLECGDPMRIISGTLGPKRGDCDVTHCLSMRMKMYLYVYSHHS
jgi:hypothetical protein